LRLAPLAVFFDFLAVVFFFLFFFI
jgi:hypothetical protein